jgi:1-acyl-sn-glycerol-3-phosphate acyltransferase
MLLRYRIVKFAMQIVRLIVLTRIRVHGWGNIPEIPYIVVLNHTSTVDTPVLLLTFPMQRWRFFAVEKWKYHPIFGPIMAWLGAIYIVRGEADRHAIRLALQAIEEGVTFGLAPEGTRSRTGQMMPAKDGAAYLASKVDVPILPVGLVNCDQIFVNFKQLKTTEVLVNIGEPFRLPEIEGRVRSRDLPAYTHYIMIHIAAQLPVSYQGVYADSPALAALLRGEDPWEACVALTAVENG